MGMTSSLRFRKIQSPAAHSVPAPAAVGPVSCAIFGGRSEMSFSTPEVGGVVVADVARGAALKALAASIGTACQLDFGKGLVPTTSSTSDH
jgi:hypothetical protein